MKSKLLIFLLLIASIASAQTSVPNTTTFTLQDVYNSVHSHASGTTGDLQSCFTNSVDSYFDAAYKGDKTNMLNFRNYTPVICPSVGDAYQGGVVAYIYQSGDPGYVAGECHGIIAAASDQATNIPWATSPFLTTNATSEALGDGDSNTSTIVSVNGTSTTYAARTCYELSLNSYTDWWLPSNNELAKLYANRAAIGGFSSVVYWSSTEVSTNNAYGLNFSTSAFVSTSKGGGARIRAIRYF